MAAPRRCNCSRDPGIIDPSIPSPAARCEQSTSVLKPCPVRGADVPNRPWWPSNGNNLVLVFPARRKLKTPPVRQGECAGPAALPTKTASAAMVSPKVFATICLRPYQRARPVDGRPRSPPPPSPRNAAVRPKLHLRALLREGPMALPPSSPLLVLQRDGLRPGRPWRPSEPQPVITVSTLKVLPRVSNQPCATMPFVGVEAGRGHYPLGREFAVEKTTRAAPSSAISAAAVEHGLCSATPA